MTKRFMIYGANGFVGREIARLAVKRGLAPVLAGRNEARVKALADELDLEYRVFGLGDPAAAVDVALEGMAAVFHCAGPYIDTFKPVVEACLRSGAHYLDLTGEIPVYQALFKYDEGAKERGVMILPGAGFDVVTTDCLAVHLKNRLPSATHLSLAFHNRGPAGLPPGTLNTLTKTIQYGVRYRREGRLVSAPRGGKSRMVDFGYGPRETTMLSWGDIFMAFHSTGIPNIEDYTVLPKSLQSSLNTVQYIRPLFKLSPVQALVKMAMPSGSTAAERAATHTHVWGEVTDAHGGRAVSRLHGPEAGVEWTALAALATVEKVLGGQAPAGFQTPGTAYGADFALESEGVTREDVD